MYIYNIYPGDREILPMNILAEKNKIKLYLHKYNRVGEILHCIFNLSAKCSQVISFINPGQFTSTLLSTESTGGSEPVWTWLQKQKSLPLLRFKAWSSSS
jgi:hypothetical protein